MIDRLLVIAPGFPADESDTSCLPAVQTYVRELGRVYPDLNLRIIALQYPYAPRAYQWHDIPVRAIGGANRGGRHKAATWVRAARTIFEWPCTLIHSFWIGECTLLGALASRRFGCAHVASIGGQELRRRTAYSSLLRLPSYSLVAGSDHAAQTARARLGRSVDAVIPLGLNLEDLAAARSRAAERPPERDVDVLFVGSLIPLKRAAEAIDVACHLPTARFVIAGEGPLGAALERSAPPNVAFTGQLPREEILRMMRRSKVLLHPSEYEGQGYVFLEALASGMHVVCRDVGNPGSSAKVHRCTTVGEMTQTVSGLLQGADEYFPVAVPTAEETVRAYAELYEEAVSGQHD